MGAQRDGALELGLGLGQIGAFGMTVVSTHKTALYRQMNVDVRIANKLGQTPKVETGVRAQ